MLRLCLQCKWAHKGTLPDLYRPIPASWPAATVGEQYHCTLALTRDDSDQYENRDNRGTQKWLAWIHHTSTAVSVMKFDCGHLTPSQVLSSQKLYVECPSWQKVSESPYQGPKLQAHGGSCEWTQQTLAELLPWSSSACPAAACYSSPVALMRRTSHCRYLDRARH